MAASLLATLVAVAPVAGASPADLQPHTLRAFERYAALTESRVREQARPNGGFLYIDHLPAAERAGVVAALRRGEMHMQPVETRAPGGGEVEIEDGLIHHWLGIVFVPGVGVEEVLALVQDYDRHGEIYAPAVVRARILERRGDRFRVFMRFRKTKVITVVMDTVHEVEYVQPAADRAISISRTSSVREVQDPGEAGETILADGVGGGFLWRLSSYWRFIERDGGTYIECESISLTRTIPFVLRWLIGPFVNDVPREQLADLLTTTRARLTARP
jgi:hypothetical protein